MHNEYILVFCSHCFLVKHKIKFLVWNNTYLEEGGLRYNLFTKYIAMNLRLKNCSLTEQDDIQFYGIPLFFSPSGSYCTNGCTAILLYPLMSFAAIV